MRFAGKLDLLAGIVLGVAIGLALAYLVVFVIAGGDSGSGVSTDTTAPQGGQTTKGEPPGRVAPPPPGQRR
jgi:hypothetical protein